MLKLLEKNNKIIINLDIDGIISGLLLHHYANCEVVGFSNSNNCVWIDSSKIKSIYDGVYIDMFVSHPKVICIDQHIISANEIHHQILNKNPNKRNPNLLVPHFHFPADSYKNKYPFSTCLFIIAELEKAGIEINLPLAHTLQHISCSDLILRADDTLKTTIASPYAANAKDWWNWLIQYSKEGKTIIALYDYLLQLNPLIADIKKDKIKNLFTAKPFYCPRPEGGYLEIISKKTMQMRYNVKQFIEFISHVVQLESFSLNATLTAQYGEAIRITISQSQINELIQNNSINNKPIFSYAFVKSVNSSENFSYTVMR